LMRCISRSGYHSGHFFLEFVGLFCHLIMNLLKTLHS
jgi:hypothetical protein